MSFFSENKRSVVISEGRAFVGFGMPKKEADVTGGLKVGLALVVGYFLGRHRRFKLAIALAVAGATGRLGGVGGNLLEQGMKLAGSSPELEKIVDSVRGELFQAGKAAAKAATTRQVTSLSTKLQERAESLQRAAEAAADLEETAGSAAQGAAKTARGVAGGVRDKAAGVRGARSRTARPMEAEEEEPYEDQYDEFDEDAEEEEYEEPPRPRRAPDKSTAQGRPARGARRTARDEDEEPDDEEAAPGGRVARDRPPSRTHPVRRTRG